MFSIQNIMYARARAFSLSLSDFLKYFIDSIYSAESTLKSMKGDRISSDIRNVRVHDLRSNDLRTKNIIILRAS